LEAVADYHGRKGKNVKIQKEYLVCIDSDGCAIDSMNRKHTECFGPALVEVWGLEGMRDVVLDKWNEINLSTMTRGINRFKGLALIMEQLHIEKEENVRAYTAWTEQAKELSNQSLLEVCETCGNPVFERAARWSLLVNEKIEGLPVSMPFAAVRGCIDRMHREADISVVSSANEEAITDEWRSSGLMDHVDYLFSQSDGSKRDCIRSMIERGYEREHILMIGDAPGDYDAADFNGAWYYPILAGKEEESWERLMEYFELFVKGEFSAEIQRVLTLEMKRNLNET